MYFFACTKYHILVSLMIRNHLANSGDSGRAVLIISDRIDGAEAIFEKTVTEGLWDKVILFHSGGNSTRRKLFGLETLLKLTCIKFNVEKLIRQEKIDNICVFTVGDPASNFFSASKLILKKYLCEDGTYPYYAGIEMYDYSGLIYRESRANNQDTHFLVKNFLTRYLDKFFLLGLVVDAKSWFARILLMNEGLYNASCDTIPHQIVQIQCNKLQVESDFVASSNIFNYIENDLYNDVDLVFIDSGMVGDDYLSMSKQVDFTFDALSRFGSQSIVIKLGPYTNQEKLDYVCSLCVGKGNIKVDLQNINVPWEIVFFNNRRTLSEATIATYMSTAAFSPFLFFDIKTNITVLSKLVTGRFEMSVQYRLLYDHYGELLNVIRPFYKNKIINIPERRSSL